MNVSPIDKVYFEIFGQIPNKAGTAYEQLACIAEHIMKQGDIKHDAKIRGEFSKSLYQIDVLSTSESGVSMGEAKDYSIQGKKVGRGDLQKLGGALPDLKGVTSGTFYSATGFTAPAKQYAEASNEVLNGKGIELYEFRVSTEVDEEGTIQKIVINMHIVMPQPQRGQWIPHLSHRGNEAGKNLIPSGEKEYHFNHILDEFCNEDGAVVMTLGELTTPDYGVIHSETNATHACYVFSNYYINLEGVLVEIKGLEYEIPHTTYDHVFEIGDDCDRRFVIKDSGGEVISIISDKQIKKYCFDTEGQLIAPVEING